MSKTYYLEGARLEQRFVKVEDISGRTEEIETLALVKVLPEGFGWQQDQEVAIAVVSIFDQLRTAAYGNRNCQVGYFITEQPMSWEQCQQVTAEIALGLSSVSADVTHVYSEVSGHLWTDESLEVDGHDLLAELKPQVGHYVTLRCDID